MDTSRLENVLVRDFGDIKQDCIDFIFSLEKKKKKILNESL